MSLRIGLHKLTVFLHIVLPVELPLRVRGAKQQKDKETSFTQR